MDASTTQERERRGRMRFPIHRELRYKLMEGNVVVAHGTGETIDISSGGIRFTAGSQLPLGVVIELSISWPVLLHDDTHLRLASIGRVVRSSGDFAACTVDKYEFRTQARSVTPPLRAVQESKADNQPAGPALKTMAAAAGAGPVEPGSARSYMLARLARGR